MYQSPWAGSKYCLHQQTSIVIMKRFCWRSSTAEQLICNQQVAGSNPIASSTSKSESLTFFGCLAFSGMLSDVFPMDLAFGMV
jgi:hypothetical protein